MGVVAHPLISATRTRLAHARATRRSIRNGFIIGLTRVKDSAESSPWRDNAQQSLTGLITQTRQQTVEFIKAGKAQTQTAGATRTRLQLYGITQMLGQCALQLLHI